MISVLLLGFDGTNRTAAAPGDAVRTLAALVPATVDGVVRDLCLAGPDEAGLAQVANHAGCVFAPVASVREAFRAGARMLRQPQVLVTHAGVVIDRAVIEELATLLPVLSDRSSGAWALKADQRDLLRRLFPSLAATAALICPRTALLDATATSLADLAQRAKGKRTMRTTALANV